MGSLIRRRPYCANTYLQQPNMDLLGISGFYPVITAGIRSWWFRKWGFTFTPFTVCFLTSRCYYILRTGPLNGCLVYVGSWMFRIQTNVDACWSKRQFPSACGTQWFVSVVNCGLALALVGSSYGCYYIALRPCNAECWTTCTARTGSYPVPNNMLLFWHEDQREKPVIVI